MKYICLLILGVVMHTTAQGAMFTEQPVEQHIKQSDLIISGELVMKSSKLEDIRSNYTSVKGGVKTSRSETGTAIMTTFVIRLDEVLYGKYNKPLIEVKMRGGCHDGRCTYLSYNYDSEVGDQLLLFLKYDHNNGFYKATSGAYSTFEVDTDERMRRKADEDEIIRDVRLEINQDGETSMTKNESNLSALRKVIMELGGAK